MKNYLIHNDIHINHDMAANTQEASNSIRQGKWLRNPVFIYCCESLGSMLNLSFLDRYLPQLLTMIFWVNNQKKLLFFLFTKSKIGSAKQRFTMNGCIFSYLSKYVEQTFIFMKAEEKIFLNLLCIYINGFRKGARATCIPKHSVLGDKHQQNNNTKESKADFITVECLHFLITWIYTLQIL